MFRSLLLFGIGLLQPPTPVAVVSLPLIPAGNLLGIVGFAMVLAGLAPWVAMSFVITAVFGAQGDTWMIGVLFVAHLGLGFLRRAVDV